MTLWIFGDSFGLPFDMEHADQGWPSLLGKSLGADLKNFAAPAADNLFIYSCYLENRQHIQSQDVCVVGWSHPSRKSFVFDQYNANHIDAIDNSHVYTTSDQKFFRNKNSKNIEKKYWLPHLKPAVSGKQFYDTWFENYYSEHEQKCNLQSYYDSVKYTCAGQCIVFFFSEESTAGMTVNDHNFALDFVVKHQLHISDTNMHFNQHGHVAWADHLHKQMQQ
jgi:hypothetical protein